MTDSSNPTEQVHALIVAAGRGERSGLDQPKQFAPVKGEPMLCHSARSFLTHNAISGLWVVIGPGQEEIAAEALAGLPPHKVVPGGATRQESVCNGLVAIHDAGGAKHVMIHDAARPFLSHDMIDRLIMELRQHDGVIPVLPTVDTVTTLAGRNLAEAVDRNLLWRVQTPQAFDFEKLYLAHQDSTMAQAATDDAQIFKAAGHDIFTIEGEEALGKFTTASDFADTSNIRMTETRTGMGYDVHQLVPDEELWLGGLNIDHEKGLAGHSDADVLLHALTDALLGAVGAGDIGDHFPPSDPQWRGAASDKFVKFAASVIKEKGGRINNVDMTVICEAPKIKPHRKAMRDNIAEMLEIDVDRVGLKATTTEGLGFTGRKEGIAAQAIATIILE